MAQIPAAPPGAASSWRWRATSSWPRRSAGAGRRCASAACCSTQPRSRCRTRRGRLLLQVVLRGTCQWREHLAPDCYSIYQRCPCKQPYDTLTPVHACDVSCQLLSVLAIGSGLTWRACPLRHQRDLRVFRSCRGAWCSKKDRVSGRQRLLTAAAAEAGPEAGCCTAGQESACSGRPALLFSMLLLDRMSECPSLSLETVAGEV